MMPKGLRAVRGFHGATAIRRSCPPSTLSSAVGGFVLLSADVTTDGFRSDEGPVEAGFTWHHRIDKYYARDHPVFSENGFHIEASKVF